MNDSMLLMEEALLNSIPAEQTVLLDGWAVRLNRNYTYRANCACPLQYTEDGAKDKVRICEDLFASNRIPPVFQVTPVLQKGFADLLSRENYQNVKTVKVMHRRLGNEAEDGSVPLRYMENPDRDFLSASAALSGLSKPDLIEIHCQNLKSIAVPHVFIEALNGDKVIGCGYGTAERGLVGIYDLHVNAAYRRRGIGTAICRAVFRFGARRHAESAYLIVHGKNQNAISLYSHMGFTLFYEYHFYSKPSPDCRIFDA